ncbi:MAG TPA: SPFH domain-containing protein [Polyangiaceae bacterium]|nr:SPFH domain-containing protein [Polyangiaceae bacterium]
MLYAALGGAFVAILVLPSLKVIGPTQVGLVVKRFGRSLPGDDLIAFNGEAGYQADLLSPGWRFVLWFAYRVEKHPWVQVPAGEIGVVVAQVGRALPIGAKSARYRSEFGNFGDLRNFMAKGGEKGVQRPVLPPGSLVPLHPVAFLAITKSRVYGVPASPELKVRSENGKLAPVSFGLHPQQLELVRIEPVTPADGAERIDTVGIVTALEGDPLPPGFIASRLGDFADVAELEVSSEPDALVIDTLLGSKSQLHNNYQDFQAFVDRGGRIGLQHDPLLYGAYALNPFLVRVEVVPMLVVRQGEVAVIKSYVGLSTQDTSGVEFKFGSLVRPGHRGIWREPLRTGKYAINPRCYRAELVPTAILTLNWAETVSQAHSLDRQLSQIIAKSREGFVFKIDLQVQIHVPDTRAPWVISMVGSMQNLVNEVLQAAVGNHFRDKLQSMPAIRFIETRQNVQEEALSHIEAHLRSYEVETKGVYIQDVVFPSDLVRVLTEREIANQEIETFRKQEEAQRQRTAMEQSKGVADMQAELARSRVGVEIKSNDAEARKREGEGEAAYIRETGAAHGAEVEAVGLARARAYAEQVRALGPGATALVNLAGSLADSKNRFVPEVMVGQGSSLEALAATLTRLATKGQPLFGNGGDPSLAAPEQPEVVTNRSR